MYVRGLELVDFRSYTRVVVELEPGPCVLVGPNGVGKTNLVEALAYVATLSSHRVATDAPLVRFGATRAVVRCAIVHDERELLVELSIEPGKANRARLGRSNVTRARDILGALKLVSFAPEDLTLVRGDPSERRRYLDDLLVSRQPRFAGVRADYDRVLKQRNALLRSSYLARKTGGNRGGDLSTLDVWDTHLAQHGAKLLAARLDLTASLAPHIARAYDAVSAGRADARITYSPSWLPEQDSSKSSKGSIFTAYAATPVSAPPVPVATVHRAPAPVDNDSGTGSAGSADDAGWGAEDDPTDLHNAPEDPPGQAGSRAATGQTGAGSDGPTDVTGRGAGAGTSGSEAVAGQNPQGAGAGITGSRDIAGQGLPSAGADITGADAASGQGASSSDDVAARGQQGVGARMSGSHDVVGRGSPSSRAGMSGSGELPGQRSGARAATGPGAASVAGLPTGIADIEAALLAALAEARPSEVERGTTLVGPHRDDLVLTLGELPAKGYASHGESWSYALALRLASYDLLRADGIEPVLALDDVFAELDAGRRDRLAQLVSTASQVIVTCAVDADVPRALRGARYEVGGGEVSRAG